MWPNYKHSIINITNSLYRFYGVEHTHCSLDTLDTFLTKSFDHVCVVLLDGFGVNLLKTHLKKEAFLNTHLQDTLTSVFPATTVAATTAILTGLTPYETGYLGWYQYFKNDDVYYTVFLNQDYYNPSKPLKNSFYKDHFGYTPFYQLIEQETGIKGKAFYPFPIDKNGYKVVEDGFKSWIDFTFKHDKTISYFYVTEPDLTEHQHGVKSAETKSVVQRLNTLFETQQNHLRNNTLVILTADHGLTDVNPIPLLDYHDITSTFKHLPSNEPRATFFFIKPGRNKDFERCFNEHFGKDFKLFTTESFLSKHYFGEGKPHDNIRACSGDYIAVAHGSYYFSLDPNKAHKAHHAGTKNDEMLVPLIVFTDTRGNINDI